MFCAVQMCSKYGVGMRFPTLVFARFIGRVRQAIAMGGGMSF